MWWPISEPETQLQSAPAMASFPNTSPKRERVDLLGAFLVPAVTPDQQTFMKNPSLTHRTNRSTLFVAFLRPLVPKSATSKSASESISWGLPKKGVAANEAECVRSRSFDKKSTRSRVGLVFPLKGLARPFATHREIIFRSVGCNFAGSDPKSETSKLARRAHRNLAGVSGHG